MRAAIGAGQGAVHLRSGVCQNGNRVAPGRGESHTAAMSDAPPPAAAVPERPPFWFRRRRIPLPTWRLWFVLLSAAAIAGWLLIPRLHGWLAVVDPVPDAPYVIVEGWVPEYVLEQVMEDTDTPAVKRIFTTGVPLDHGTFLTEFRDYAHLSALTMAKMGIDPQRICAAPAQEVKLERTRAMAAALKVVLDGENIPAADRRINLYTLGTHARRSRRIFQETLGPGWEVGVIAIPSRDYDAAQWYKQSAGAKTVINELIALTMQSGGGQ